MVHGPREAVSVSVALAGMAIARLPDLSPAHVEIREKVP
jgi:hypothetical protein